MGGLQRLRAGGGLSRVIILNGAVDHLFDLLVYECRPVAYKWGLPELLPAGHNSRPNISSRQHAANDIDGAICALFLHSLGVFARASFAPSTRSSGRSKNTGRPSMSATRSFTTSSWWRASRPKERSSSRTCRKYRPTPLPFSAPTGSPTRSKE